MHKQCHKKNLCYLITSDTLPFSMSYFSLTNNNCSILFSVAADKIVVSLIALVSKRAKSVCHIG